MRWVGLFCGALLSAAAAPAAGAKSIGHRHDEYRLLKLEAPADLGAEAAQRDQRDARRAACAGVTIPLI